MFANNIPDDADTKEILGEAKRMGLDREDLTDDPAEEQSGLTPNPMSLIDSKKPDEKPAEQPQPKKPAAKQPEADEESDEAEEPKKPAVKSDEESEEGEDDGQPSADSNKAITRGEFGKFTRSLRKEMADGINKLAETMKTFSQAKTPEQKEAAAGEVKDQMDAITEFAQKARGADGKPLDPAGLKELYGIFEKMVMSKIPLDKLNQLDQIVPVVNTVADSINQDQIITDFNAEYDEFQPTLAKEFPNATPAQWKAAKTLLRDLATSEQYGYVEGKHEAYPLAHIVAIEQQKIRDVLFSPKRKTAESGQLGNEPEGESPQEELLRTNYENMTPKKAAQLNDLLNDDNDYEL